MRLIEFIAPDSFSVIPSGSVKLGGKTFVQHAVDARQGMKLVLIDADLLEKLWAKSGEGWVVGKGPEYKNQISKRIENFKKFYDENKEIRVGDVHIHENGRAGFGDGRHRTRVLIELGFEQIPISMDSESLSNLENL